MGASGNRVAVALGVATVVLTSCGGGDGGGSTGGSTVGEPAATESSDLVAPTANDRGSVDGGSAIAAADLAELPAEFVAVVDLAVETHGDPGGAAAIVYAIERGYNAAQLAGPGDLAADGVLQTDGAEIVPENSRALAVFLPEDENGGSAESLRSRPQGFQRSPVGDLGQVDIAALFEAALRDGGSSAAFAATIVSLDESGYDLEQIIAETIFGEVEVWTETGGCTRIGYLPVRPARLDSSCALGIDRLADELDAVDESAAVITDPPADTPIAEGESDADRPRGVYQATLEDISPLLGADSSSVVSNLLSVDLDGDVPELALLWVANLTGSYDLSPDVDCVIEARIEIERAPLVGATFVDGTWSGEVTASIGSYDGTCTPGSQGNQAETGPISVTFTATDTTLTGAFTGEGDTLAFAGTAVS